MLVRRLAPTFWLTVATALLVMASSAANSNAQADASQQATASSAATDDDLANLMAATQLAADYKVPLTEALRRIARQPAAHALDHRLAELAPSYAGLWMDQSSGMIQVEVVDSLDLELVRATVEQASLQDYVQVLQVQSSRATLRSAYNAASKAVQEQATVPARQLGVAYRVRKNAIALEVPESLLEDVRASTWFQSLVRAFPQISLETQAGAVQTSGCVFPECDPPMRGGRGHLLLEETSTVKARHITCSAAMASTCTVRRLKIHMFLPRGTAIPQVRRQPSRRTSKISQYTS